MNFVVSTFCRMAGARSFYKRQSLAMFPKSLLRGNYSVCLNKGRSDTLEAFRPAMDAWEHRILPKSPAGGLLPQAGPFYLSLSLRRAKGRRLLAWLGGISPHTFHSAFSKQKNLNRKLTLKGEGVLPGPPSARSSLSGRRKNRS